MAVTEAAKHDLYTHLQQTMGKERADTLMAMVSPTGWEDVATKQGVQHEITTLRTEMTAEFKLVRIEMGQFVTKAYLEKALRTQLYAIYVFNGIFMSLAVGLAQAIGG